MTMPAKNGINNIRLPPKWVELNFTKRECCTFLEVPGEESVCQCGRRKVDHGDFVKLQHRPELWTPSVHTRAFSTDAYGTILFEGEHHPNKAHYVRLSYDTSPETILQMMRYVWGLQMPKLVISVRGGSTNFHLNSRLGKIFQTGLIKAAKTTSAWIFSSGLNLGVSKHLGTAVNNARWIGGSKRERVVTVGIAPWGMCEHRNELIGRNKERVYSGLERPGSKFLHLNPRHSNFLLVDNGSAGRFGGETYLRRRLEKCISTYPCSPNRGCDTPVVAIVLEGAFHTLRLVHEYLYDDSPIPVVIFAGTGRCADLIAWVINNFTSEDELNDNKDEIMKKIVHMFPNVNGHRTYDLFIELKEIFGRRSLVTIYNPNATTEAEEFDAVILASIFRSQHWSPLQQLSLTLVWDRVDIAQNEVFVYGREWSRDNLEHALVDALVSNRLDFVTLLLEHGLNMQSFLTASRLESLYGWDCIKSNAIAALLMEFSQTRAPKNFQRPELQKTKNNLTLHEVGIILSHMMGHIYKSNYINVVAKVHEMKDGNVDDEEIRAQTFPSPFDDLFIWAVLTERHEMSKLLWIHGRGALAKSLVAVKLNKYFAQELTTSERTMMNLVTEYENNAEEWENLSLSLLDSCYRQDSKMARQLLTMELEQWSKQTCLTLAVRANHRTLLGHPCCQILLADLWMGALNIKSGSTLKIILGIIFFPFVFILDYKSKEELQLLPHQEKNHAFQNVHRLSHGSKMEKANPQYGPEPNEDDDDEYDSYKSIYTYDSTKSRDSLTSVFRKRKKCISERKTDLADVASKIAWENTENFAGGDIADGTGTSLTCHFKPKPPVPLRHGKVVQRPAQFQLSRDNTLEPSLRGIEAPVHEPVKGRLVNQSKLPSFITTEHELSVWCKFVEFHKAPATNFYRHTIAYLLFIIALTYVILYPQDRKHFGWVEIYVIACLVTQGLECIREFISLDALSCSQKCAQMRDNVWQLTDFFVLLAFLSGSTLRFFPGYFRHAMLLYQTSSIYWNLRLYKYLGVHRFIGPKILMMSRMFSHMAYFAMIILVVIFSFGIAREAIRFPKVDPTFEDLSEAFLEPYIMMFGEVDLDAISPECGGQGQDECPIGSWFIPIAWVIYMMVANILIVNVLIAVFNGIYAEIDANAIEVWMFQRFTFVMEFEQKPPFPPPFIIINHIISLLRYAYTTCMSCICEEEFLEPKMDDDEQPHIIMGNDHSLKTFFSATERHMIYDFEEENVDVVQQLLYKDQTPLSVGGKDRLISLRNALTSEKIAIQQLRKGLQDLYSEMETQRVKLDKLLSWWEMDIISTAHADDNDSSIERLILSSESSTSSQTRTVRL